MTKKGKGKSQHDNEDETMFAMFLRMLLRNVDPAKRGFTHDLEPQRRRFLRRMFRLFRQNHDKKEGDE